MIKLCDSIEFDNIIELFMSKSCRKRENAIRQLEALAEKRQISKLHLRLFLRAAISDPSIFVRDDAFELLGVYGEKSDIPFISKGLRDKEWVVRYSAVDSAGLLGATNLDKALRNLAMKDRIPLIRGMCAVSLAKIKGKEILVFLQILREREKKNIALIRILFALALAGNPPQIEEFADLLDTNDSNLMVGIPAIINGLAELNVYSIEEISLLKNIARRADHEWREKMFHSNDEKQTKK